MKTNFVAGQVSELAGRAKLTMLFKLLAKVAGSTSGSYRLLSAADDVRVTCVYPNTTGVAELGMKANSRGDYWDAVSDGAFACNLHNLDVGTYVATLSGTYGSVPFESKVVIVVRPNESHTDVSGISSVVAEVPVIEYIETPATPTE